MKKLICIECPKGCHLTVDDQLNVSGNSCPRGAKYARLEVTEPKRMLTSTVIIKSSLLSRLPVISSEPIPKERIFDVMEALNHVVVYPPISCKDVVLANVCDLHIDILSTRTIEK